MVVIKAGILGNIDWLFHAFFTRLGGFSEPPFKELNLSFTVGDNPPTVAQNWEKVKSYLPFREVHLLRQIHGDKIYLTNRFWGKSPIWLDEGDALITNKVGLGIGILTADCAPVFLVNLSRKKIAAVHSGWRGTVAKIVVKALNAIREAEDDKIIAVIGPTISGEKYMVGEEVIEQVKELEIDNMEIWWQDSEGFYHLDIPSTITHLLLKNGVNSSNIVSIPCCTYKDDSFYSYRRDGITGRQLSVIGIIKNPH